MEIFPIGTMTSSIYAMVATYRLFSVSGCNAYMFLKLLKVDVLLYI